MVFSTFLPRKVLVKFIGENDQIPPNFSAKKINGERAYDLARKGIDFELKPKEIEIYDFQLLNKMDKNTVIGLVLIMAVIFGFSWLNQPSKEELARRQHVRDSIAAANESAYLAQ